MSEKIEKKDFKTMIGGQALIEGIMMVGPEKIAIVVRGPEKLEIKEGKRVILKEKCPIFGWIFIRGIFNMIFSLTQGMKALTWSSNFYPEETTDNPSKLDLWFEKNVSSEKAQKVAIAIGMVFGLLIAVGLFTVLPTFVGGLVESAVGKGWGRNLVETCLRVVLLIGYMAAVSKMKDIQRVFGYHGAEHKSIACYEAGDELTVENVKKYTRKHPRCGTSFLLTVVIISLFVFALTTTVFNWVEWSNPFFRIAARLLMLPIVVGISYEINRLIGRIDNVFTRIVRSPGIWLQNLTTREPDDSMIEVAIHAIKLVIPAQKGLDKWGE